MALLRNEGLNGLSLRAAARRAGVSAMAPYRHFADRDAMLAALAAHGFELLRERLTAAGAVPDAETGLIAQGLAYIRLARDEPALFRLMFGPSIPDRASHPELAQAGRAAFMALQGAVDRLAPMASEASRANAALACWALVHGFASLVLDGQLGADDLDAAADRLTWTLLEGLRRRLSLPDPPPVP